MLTTSKTVGATNTDTFDVKSECHWQLYDMFTYSKLSEETKEEFIRNVEFQIKSIVKKTFIQWKLLF